MAWLTATWRWAALAVFTAIAAGAPAAAQARWDVTVERDDFGSKHVGIAVTLADGRALALRCENERVPALVFATRELWSERLSAIPATLLVKIDDGEAFRKPAVLEQYPMMVGLTQQLGVRVVALGDHLFPILDAIAKGKDRVAVAIEIAGERFENTRFRAKGSKAAFNRIWGYCGSKLGTYDKPDL
ncbi:MAG: hypothetical protein JNM89_09285 [Hyphomicrobiaceae bacterium]|nr:hypothetical protein [Hyphomicrobiaceae bacterium]